MHLPTWSAVFSVVGAIVGTVYRLIGIGSVALCVIRTRGHYSRIELLCIATGVYFWWPIVFLTELVEYVQVKRDRRAAERGES